jgi:hypothetical protein
VRPVVLNTREIAADKSADQVTAGVVGGELGTPAWAFWTPVLLFGSPDTERQRGFTQAPGAAVPPPRSLRDIAAELAQRGIMNELGVPFSAASINAMLAR